MIADLPPPVLQCEASAEDARHSDIVVANAARARARGDYASARLALAGVVCREPANADAWLQLGLTYASEGRDQQARQAFLQVLALAPDYDDARLGLARLAYRAGDLSAARRWLNEVDPRRANDEETRELRTALVQAQQGETVWRMGTVLAYSILSESLAPWREVSIAVTRQEGQTVVGATIEHADRFGQSDSYGELFVQHGEEHIDWAVAVGAALDPTFKPEALLRMEASAQGAQWRFDGAVTLARYEPGTVTALKAGVGESITKALDLQVQGVMLRDESGDLRFGYGANIRQRLGERHSLTLAWTDAPETSDGSTVDVRSVALRLNASVSPQTDLSVGLVSEDRAAFDRVELSIAARRRF